MICLGSTDVDDVISTVEVAVLVSLLITMGYIGLVWFDFGLIFIWFWFGFNLVWFWFDFYLVLVWIWFGLVLVWFGLVLV